ncbi:hypothetical protein GF391_03380 [Candidatus Uhrbacteria bacterium]|nr:hypothetical protein [Candidatus Uhrbacteria bacterium]
MYKKYFLSIMAVLLAVMWAMPVFAAQYHGGESVTVPTANDDVYAGGANIFTDGDIDGDLYAAGAVVRCNSNVSEDVVMAGSVVDLFGNVGDDVRLAGSMVTIGGEVGDDLIVFGAMIRILPDTVIKGDITSLGGSIIVDGKTEGNLLAYGGQVIVNGEINGSAMIEAEEVVIGKSAKIDGVMQYKSMKEADIPVEAQIAGGVEYSVPDKKDKPKWDKKKPAEMSAGAMFGFGLLAFLIKVLVGIFTVLAALYFFKKHLLEMTKSVLNTFPAQLGWGFVWAVVVPVACIVLIFTIFGSTLGFF